MCARIYYNIIIHVCHHRRVVSRSVVLMKGLAPSFRIIKRLGTAIVQSCLVAVKIKFNFDRVLEFRPANHVLSLFKV